MRGNARRDTTSPGLAQTNGNEWDLVACTYDGANLCGYAFPNGSASPATTCNAYTQSLDTNVGYGTTIGECAIPTYGSQFVRSLDQVRIYARTLSRRIAPQRPAESAQCFYLLSFLVAVVRASDAAKRNDRVWM
jgi:hypothetical protein